MICLSGIIWYCGSKSQLKQLIDLPSNIEGAKDGKGNRRIIIYVARTLNLILFVLEAVQPLKPKSIIEVKLEMLFLDLI